MDGRFKISARDACAILRIVANGNGRPSHSLFVTTRTHRTATRIFVAAGVFVGRELSLINLASTPDVAMHSLILAAGMGKRLGKYTKNVTKCMVEVAGRPLIMHAIEALDAAGIDRLVLVVGYQAKNLYSFLGRRKGNVEIDYVTNPLYEQTNNIFSLFLAREYLLRDDTLLLESDVMFEPRLLQDVLDDARPDLAVVDRYQPWMDGTVVTLDADADDDAIASFVPKYSISPNRHNDYFKTVNIYKFSKDFARTTYVPFLEAFCSALGKNGYYEQVLKVIASLDTRRLKAYRLAGHKWYEIDNPQDKENAETLFVESRESELARLDEAHGGYWRYPDLKDFRYLANPYFPTPQLVSELTASLPELLSHYPSGFDVQQRLASQLFGTRPEQIVVGNGASELIRAIALTLDGTVGIVFPSFNEYAESFGDRIKPWITARDDFSYTTSDLTRLAKRCDNLVLINPDNPTGHFIDRNEILEFADWLKGTGCRLIVDESFVDFSARPGDQTLIDTTSLDEYPGLVVIKSLGKSYGVPGARLGVLASGNRAIVDGVKTQLPIWNINSFGEYFLQVIGRYQGDHFAACKRVSAERQWLHARLNNIAFLRPFPSEANYVACEVTAKLSASQLTYWLLQSHGILIKDLTGKAGMDGGHYIRIAVRDRSDNATLLNALEELEMRRNNHALTASRPTDVGARVGQTAPCVEVFT